MISRRFLRRIKPGTLVGVTLPTHFLIARWCTYQWGMIQVWVGRKYVAFDRQLIPSIAIFAKEDEPLGIDELLQDTPAKELQDIMRSGAEWLKRKDSQKIGFTPHEDSGT